jgi:hypothetical protein
MEQVDQDGVVSIPGVKESVKELIGRAWHVVIPLKRTRSCDFSARCSG